MQNLNLNKAKSKMLSFENKNKAIAIVCILLMTLSALFVIAPSAKAYSVFDAPRATGTFVGVSPQRVGLTQQVLINILVYPAPSGPTWYAQDLAYYLQGFNNVSCTITAPDGTKSTFMPTDFTLDHAGITIPGATESVGSLEFYYTPTQVGNYSVTASFPGQTFTDKVLNNANDTVLYQQSSSTVAATFTVQQDIVLGGLENGYPWSPLPTGYWENPVSSNNREWATVSGDWLRATFDYLKTDYQPYSTAPTTPHIVWKSQIAPGGVVGGAFGNLGYGNLAGGGGNAAITSIVIDGRMYQNDFAGNTFSCWDLRTGKFLWRQNGIITQAQHLQPYFQTAAQAAEGGIQGILWDFTSTPGVWKQFDWFTGASVANYSSAPTGGTISVYMTEGDPLVYVLQYGGWNTTIRNSFAYENMLMWNLTRLNSASGIANGAFGQPTASTVWTNGIQWNVSIRQPNGAGIGDGRTTVVLWPFLGVNRIIVTANFDEGYMFGFDATTGKYLYNATTVIPIGEDTGGPNGPYIAYDGATASWYAYNPVDGKQMWTAPAGKLPWSAIPVVLAGVVNNGMWYEGTCDGHVYAFDLATGNVKWTSDWTGATDETIYGDQPFNSQGLAAGADGQLYFSTGTVYGLQPKTRFHALYDINETTGKFIWTLGIGELDPVAIADGYLVTMDGDNGMQYVLGKGQSSTTVTTPLNGVTSGTPITIQGTVMDQSPGKPNSPAIADANMSVWMEYLYGQNATLINNPPSCNGVPVSLVAVDPNGNSVNLGTVASDSSGTYAATFTPTTPGLYTIYATFSGSGSYYSSYAESHLTVAAASASASPTTTASASVSNSDIVNYIIAGFVAVIIAIVIVGVLLLRKK